MKKPSVLPLRRMPSGQSFGGYAGARQRGVAMLEVIIAFFVLAIGLLGLAALQMKTVQFNQGSYQRTQATIAAYDMMDRMRLNRTEATAGGEYQFPTFSATGPGTSTQPKRDVTEWLTRISTTLPDGQGSIDCDNNKMCDISVQWRDRFSTDPAAVETLTISTQVAP
jgi:type IV pilus assembly protein PilV